MVGARVRPALAFRMMYPESRISFLCDAGRGHFDLGEDTQLYIARFIEKSLADPRPAGGEFYSRWHADGSESSDPHDCFWYHDSEMVDRTRLRYSAAHGDIPRYVSAKISGQTVDYDSTRHVRMSFPLRKVLPTSAERIPDGFEFTVEPFFFKCRPHFSGSRFRYIRHQGGAHLRSGNPDRPIHLLLRP